MGRISRQTGVYFGGTLFAAGAGYLFKIYLARVLGAEALGLYALGMTITGFLGIFNTVGIPQTAVRFVAVYSAKHEYEKLRGFLGRGMAVLLLLNVVLAAALVWLGPVIAIRLYHAPELVQYLWLFAAIMLSGSLMGFWGQVLVGYKEVSQRTIISNIVGTILVMTLSVILISLGKGLRGYLLAQVFNSLVILVLFFIAAWKLTPSVVRQLRGAWPKLPRETLSFSGSLFAIDSLGFIHSHADKVFIGALLTVGDVGVYSVAATIAVYVGILLLSVNQIFSPIIADLHARHDTQMLSRLFETLTKWIIGLTLPLAFVVMIFAKPIMEMFGPRFASGWPVLVLGTMGQLVSCGVGSVGLLLVMSGNQNRLFRVQLVMAGVAIALNFALIPTFGVIGAAASAAITVAGTNLWNLAQVKTVLGLSPYNRSYFRLFVPTLSTAILVVGCRYLTAKMSPQWIAIILALVVGYAVFVCGVMLAGLNDDDRLIANAVVSKLRGLS